ncbi:hypothetical protein VFPBJ_10581 [Purpureocillium lilacinum]|uniref:Secreted protein n=1 Tax=Purpureocillium lilacinum TaxID=33203 RepID=A0A179G1T9_PURLI|nr:hypothetical protein VFPBJ_10581 [Purpureocillium lilacinum]
MRTFTIILALACRLAFAAAEDANKPSPAAAETKAAAPVSAGRLHYAMETTYKDDGYVFKCEKCKTWSRLAQACGGIEGCTTCVETKREGGQAAFRCNQTEEHQEYAAFLPNQCYGRSNIEPGCIEVFKGCRRTYPQGVYGSGKAERDPMRSCLKKELGELFHTSNIKLPNTKKPKSWSDKLKAWWRPDGTENA